MKGPKIKPSRKKEPSSPRYDRRRLSTTDSEGGGKGNPPAGAATTRTTNNWTQNWHSRRADAYNRKARAQGRPERGGH